MGLFSHRKKINLLKIYVLYQCMIDFDLWSQIIEDFTHLNIFKKLYILCLAFTAKNENVVLQIRQKLKK